MLLAGEEDFPIEQIDIDSLALRREDGAGDAVQPLLSRLMYKDLNHPFEGEYQETCSCNEEQSSDGIPDLSMKFSNVDMAIQLQLQPGEGIVVLELTGVLQDGTPFCARNCVLVVNPGL